MLPLDLHVLGLSLAFILSQDQTLRCNYIFLFFSLTNPIRCSKLLYCLKLVWRWLYLLVSYYFVFFKYSMISFLLLPFRKRVQRYYSFLFPPNIFTTFFWKILPLFVNTLSLSELFFIFLWTFFGILSLLFLEPFSLKEYCYLKMTF